MKKKILAVFMATMMSVSVAACGSSGGSADAEATPEVTEEAEAKPEATEEAESEGETTYQSILDDYTKQIQDATPGLVEEYNTESADISGDLEALAELSNSKVEKLAEICNEGVGEMAELMNKNGDEYETYEDWAGKLQDVYMEYSTQITDAYTDSASGMSTEDLMESLESLQE